MTDWIGDTFTSDAGWDHLESLVDIDHRMAGSDGERAGLELTRDALSDAGARDARIEEFEIQGWERGDSEIRRDEEVVASGQNACIALPRSPSGEATGEFVDLGYGVPEDFDDDLTGKVVMVSSDTPDSVDRFIHRREKYYHAVEAGAAAFVFANHVEGTLPPTGSVGTADAPIGDIPAVGVSKETGASLARRREGEDLTVAVNCETPDATSGNAVADLGPDTDEYLVVSCHVDAHDLAEGRWTTAPAPRRSSRSPTLSRPAKRSDTSAVSSASVPKRSGWSALPNLPRASTPTTSRPSSTSIATCSVVP